MCVVSRNGHVHVERPGGNLSAETRNGNVVVRAAKGQNTRMRSSNGTLTYAGAVNGNVDMEVEDNGPIRIGVPADSRFILDAEAVRGDIKSELAVKDNPPSDTPRPTVRLRTVNGSIKIEALAGAAS